jgi:hypothetical protein
VVRRLRVWLIVAHTHVIHVDECAWLVVLAVRAEDQALGLGEGGHGGMAEVGVAHQAYIGGRRFILVKGGRLEP